MCTSRIIRMTALLDQASLTRLKNASDAAQHFENRWMQQLKTYFQIMEAQVIFHIQKYGHPPQRLDFTEFFVEHAFEAMALGFKTAATREENSQVPHRVMETVALAKVPDQKMPRKFRDLMALWDKWRKKKVVPKRQEVLAKKVEAAYLDKVHKVWKKHSQAFRDGDEWTQDKVRQKIREASGASYARARTIVQTETTKHYNDVRREVYDQSNDVTHYLFVAVRDAATTKWCNTRQGLVYRKGDPILDTETPPIHWNCRSELLPLTPANPRHLALINDAKRDRRKRKCEPLPKGWNS